MDGWDLETFKSLLGQSVTASELEGEKSCELEIAEVTPHSYGEEREGFSVIFHTDKVFEGQGCLELKHSSYGVVVVFLSPKSEGQLEAVFN